LTKLKLNLTFPSEMLKKKKTADYRFQGNPCHSVLWLPVSIVMVHATNQNYHKSSKTSNEQ